MSDMRSKFRILGPVAAAELVGGRDLLLGLTRPYTESQVDGVAQVRDGRVTMTSEMNDPRVSGTLTFDFGIDVYRRAASEWGTMRLVNDDGAWEGPCTVVYPGPVPGASEP